MTTSIVSLEEMNADSLDFDSGALSDIQAETDTERPFVCDG